GQLPRFVVDFEDDVLAEISERDFYAQAGAEVPDLVGPLLELGIVGDAAFQGDGVIFGASRRLASSAGVATFAMLDHFGSPLQRANLADTGHVAAIPFDPEFEILVWVKALGIDAKLSHNSSRGKVMLNDERQGVVIGR